MQTKDKSSEIVIQFVNTSDNDIYVLKYHTPLEGLKSSFLTIKKNDGKKIKYNGYRFKRCPPTKEDFILLEGKTEHNCPVINLTEAYAIPREGEYTIEYTKPLFYVTKEAMAQNNIANSKKLTIPKKSLKITIAVMKGKALGDNVDIPGPGIRFQDEDNAHDEELREETRALHHEVCDAYQQVIDAIDGNPAKYELWFGHPTPDRKAKVREVFEDCRNGLTQDTVTCHFRGPKCTNKLYGYSRYGSKEVFLCELYIKANKKSQVSGEDSKQQTLVHEWTHVYANTNSEIEVQEEEEEEEEEEEVYGPKDCKELAKNNPKKATNNADNYGYFYCDIVENLPD